MELFSYIELHNKYSYVFILFSFRNMMTKAMCHCWLHLLRQLLKESTHWIWTLHQGNVYPCPCLWPLWSTDSPEYGHRKDMLEMQTQSSFAFMWCLNKSVSEMKKHSFNFCVSLLMVYEISFACCDEIYAHIFPRLC